LPQYQPDGQLSSEKAVAALTKAFKEGYAKFDWTCKMPHEDTLIPSKVTLVRIEYNNEYAVIAYTQDMREVVEANIAKDNTISSLEGILNAMDVAIYASDPVTCELLFVNTHLKKLFNIQGDEIIGKRCHEVFRNIDQRCDFCPIRQLNEEPDKLVVWDEYFPERGRHMRHCDFLIDWYDGNKAHLQYCFDTTDIVEAKEKAQEASAAKSSFLSNMSHEMRTPLNVIVGMTTIGKETKDINEKNYALSAIESASSGLLGLINDILDMAKIEANKLELSAVEYNFEEMLKSALLIVRFRAREKNQTLTVNVDKNIPLYVVGDDKRLAQVLINLLFNAVKFTQEGGEVSLNIFLAGKNEDPLETLQLRIEVCDNGIGISQGQQENLFDAFEQASKGHSRQYGGTGLGLPIAKSIIELMGGEIWVESELDKGAKFVFTTNVAQKTDDAALVQKEELPPETRGAQTLAGKQLLIVEDIEVNRRVLIKLLENKNTGLIISYAENGKQALALVSAEPEKYNFIFMDVQMPEMDGLEATRQIRALPYESCKKLPIIAVTANAFKSDAKNCFEAGMNEHLGKPVDINRAMEILHKYSENP
jgi:signal transduction histidine kinase/ActR/RegA family two-component response regulator